MSRKTWLFVKGWRRGTDLKNWFVLQRERAFLIGWVSGNWMETKWI
jgi:hypothetical protein